jgi:SWI/SNF-related matrix-associated actin-dependent regulator 1 of chromatin subfamily A
MHLACTPSLNWIPWLLSACSAARRDAEALASRSAELSRQLAAAQAAAAAGTLEAGRAAGRAATLEGELERAREEAAELRQRLATAAASSGGGPMGAAAAAAGGGAELDLARRQLQEARGAADARAAQLEAAAAEAAEARAEAGRLQQRLDALAQELSDAQRAVAARAEDVAQLRAALESREADRSELLREMQRDAAAGGARPRPGSGGADAGDAAAPDPAGAAPLLRRQLEEAQALAAFAASQSAGLVQQLAAARAEQAEQASRAAELRAAVARLRAGPEGELRGRIEGLEKDLLIARNRVEVNALLGEEHQRVATELIAAKLALAETQEALVVLRRSLIKSQERSLGFASKLTRLETRLYRRLSSAVPKRSGRGSGSVDEEPPAAGA